MNYKMSLSQRFTNPVNPKFVPQCKPTDILMNATIADEIEEAQVLIRNATQHPVIKKKLSEYGYNAQKMQAGITLLNQVQLLQQVKKDQYLSRQQISHMLQAHEATMRRHFREHRTIARCTFSEDPGTLQRLGLHRPIATRKPVWRAQVAEFYQELLRTPDPVNRYGLTKAHIEQAQAMIEAIAESYSQRLEKKADAQHATRKRNEARAALKAWIKDFKAVARVALRQDAQLLEALGISVASV